ncbi:ras-related Rab-4A isoform B [Micractinium conductrix]|uniref:Ras-related Rab-4A isoform B n=1 Tax=Micractinium conductrix TaxID=554055 RepID=A0A2P6V347_9CHLO|nr:ras-related Rab-4A isoform B [Micractinium conductrix]|eukprot:PSC68497.1 ras-related Rab-4A isoform B [Micractinium conductrix]
MARFDVNIVVIGDASCGKSCLLQRLLTNRFVADSERTWGTEFGAKRIAVVLPDGSQRRVSIGVWDTSGYPRFHLTSTRFLAGAHAILACWDATSRRSWDSLRAWVVEAREQEPAAQVFLAACKSDLVERPQQAQRGHGGSAAPPAEGLPGTGSGSPAQSLGVSVEVEHWPSLSRLQQEEEEQEPQQQVQQQQQDERQAAAKAAAERGGGRGRAAVDQYSASTGASVLWTSARTGEGVLECFQTIAQEVLQRRWAQQQQAQQQPQPRQLQPARPQLPPLSGMLVPAAALLLGGPLLAAAVAKAALGDCFHLELHRGRLYVQAGVPSTGPPLSPGAVEVRPTGVPALGNGAFAAQRIPAGTYLGDYTGELLDRPAFFARYPNGVGDFTAAVDDEWAIDAVRPVGDTATFHPVHLNHSRGRANVRRHYARAARRISFFATRDVQPGEELLYDYGRAYWRGREQMELP